MKAVGPAVDLLTSGMSAEEGEGHQASVYRTSTSWRAGNVSFSVSKVCTERFVLLRFSFRRLLMAVRRRS